jgi:hypothetical protein
MPNISQSIQELVSKYKLWQDSLRKKEGVPLISVDEIASKVAVFYEKIRMVLDWREEHLIRRNAIERVLKRKTFLYHKIPDSSNVAESLVLELVRGGYFPNNKIEESKIEEVKKALEKYTLFLEKSLKELNDKQQIELYDWLMDIASCEIEEILDPPIREKALIDYMTKVMTERIEISQNSYLFKKIDLKEKYIQTFIACHKALFKLDKTIITYYLLKEKYNWTTKEKTEQIKISEKLNEIRNELEKIFNHPLADKFYKICEKYDTPYLILHDIISENPSNCLEIFQDPPKLENTIKNYYQKRLIKVKRKIRKTAILSTLSIFLTKILIALAMEIPFEKYFFQKVDNYALLFNISIPPLLMMFLISTIKTPGKENINRVIMEVMKIVYEQTKKETYIIKKSKKGGWFIRFLVITFYFFMFLLSFGAIIYGLRKIHFNYLSIAVFLVFFSLIMFVGTKIRERAKELDMGDSKGGILAFILDSFSLPFIMVGKWLSKQWSKYNIILVIFNAFIDMPFKLFTEFIEHWRNFLKEKKEEIH